MKIAYLLPLIVALTGPAHGQTTEGLTCGGLKAEATRTSATAQW